MKYLLITTTENKNTGDELIRIGIENLIKEVDPNPQFILLDKEKPEHWENPVEFDKAILCGMPLFWNNEVSTSQTIGWWDGLMEGWVSERKKDFLILGAGNAIGLTIKDPIMYGAAIQQAVDRAYAVTVRNYCGPHPKLLMSVCPSVFALTEIGEPKYKLCNFMPEGAHDSHFNQQEANIWSRKMRKLSNYCRANDFYFIQHSNLENPIERPEELGWEKDRIFVFNTAEEYLDIYKHASLYFGNRIHGAIMAGSTGRPAIAVGYDSRLSMLDMIGYAQTPSMIMVKDIESLIEHGHEQEKLKNIRPFIHQQKTILLRLLEGFLAI